MVFIFVVLVVVVQGEVHAACPAIFPCCASNCGVVRGWSVILLTGDSCSSFIVDIVLIIKEEATNVDDAS